MPSAQPDDGSLHGLEPRRETLTAPCRQAPR
jgi:hypothetical protein